MDSLIASISLSGALLALAFSVVSLILHYVRRKETPEYTALSSQVRALEAEIVDLMDKIKHWRNRDNVRRARQGAEDKIEAETTDTPGSPDYKQSLRRRMVAAGGLIKTA